MYLERGVSKIFVQGAKRKHHKRKKSLHILMYNYLVC